MVGEFIQVKLGDFIFHGAEVPEVAINGGTQLISKHQLIGGLRVFDAMGASPVTITLRGLFQGIDSIQRVDFLDTQRVNGNQINFAYSSYNYNVIIQSFTWNFRIGYKLDYEMELAVLEDLTKPTNTVNNLDIAETLLELMITALDLANDVANPSVTNSVNALNTALTSVGDLNGPTTQEIASIEKALGDAIGSVESYIGVNT